MADNERVSGTEMGGTPVPPYEGRSAGPDDSESTRAKTESIERQMSDTKSEGDAEIGQVSAPGPSNPDPATGEDLGQP